MNLVWYGHASFLLTLDNKKKILFDPYNTDAYKEGFRYINNFPSPDIVTISHNHSDHNFRGFHDNARILDRSGAYQFETVFIEGIQTYHDSEHGEKRGGNIIFSVESEKGSVIHLGDLGVIPERSVLDKLKNSYILMSPVGGRFTIEPNEAYELLEILKPKYFVPMHYKTEFTDFPIKTVDEFLSFNKIFHEEHLTEFDDSKGDTISAGILIFTPKQ